MKEASKQERMDIDGKNGVRNGIWKEGSEEERNGKGGRKAVGLDGGNKE